MRIKPVKISFCLALCLGSALSVSSIAADAMTLQPLVDDGTRPGVTLVVGGCGVGFHRGPAGACRANGVAGVRVGVVGFRRAGVDRRVSRRTARRTSRRVARRHFR